MLSLKKKISIVTPIILLLGISPMPIRLCFNPLPTLFVPVTQERVEGHLHAH